MPNSSSRVEEKSQKSRTLLQPNHNCWRVETATRLQFLIDGAAYFQALRASLRNARRAIYIIGWDIDSRVALPRHGIDDNLPEPLAQFLDALARSRSDLHIYVLSWDYALLFALEREWLPVLQLQWRTHRRVHFRLDKQHPIGASQHQKLVVIDDRVAFIGGIDITRCRLDSPAHSPDDPLRRDADGNAYAPFHDVQAIVEGPVASALGDLARSRWQRATRYDTLQHELQPLKNNAAHASPWPVGLEPALENIRVAIARTESEFENYSACAEIRNFYLDAIAAARNHIFFENQYFSSNSVAEALHECLQRPDGPAVVVVTPHRESGWLEENTMGLLRARLYDRLRASAGTTRFYPYCPMLANDVCLNVHSKLMIVDDEWLTLGSANVSNRSMSLDTECNLILEAASQGERADAVRQAIAHLRNSLLAEHLGCAIETIFDLQQKMNLPDAIETVRRGNTNRHQQRTLIPAEPLPSADNIFVSDDMLVDPETPLEPERVIASYIASRDRKSVRTHAAYIGIAVIVLGVLILLWRETPLREFLQMNTVLAFVQNLQRQPLAPLWILATYVIAGFVFVPVVLLIAATGMVFGPWLGLIYATCGSLLSAAATFWIGSKTDPNLWRRLFRGRVQRLQPRLQKRGLLAVAIIRVLPIAPFTVVNLIAGAAQISWRDFLLGTLTGMLPGIIMTVMFIDRAATALRRPTLSSIATLVLTMGIIVAVSLLLQHWLRHKNLSGNAEQ